MEYLTVLDEKDSGSPACCLCAVRNHKNSLSLPIYFSEYIQKSIGCLGIQGAGRFISKNQFRVCDQCSCHCAALLLTARYLIGIFFQKLGNVKGLGNGADFLCHFPVIFPGKHQRKVNVVS